MRRMRILALSALALPLVLVVDVVHGRVERSLRDAPINVTSITAEELDLNLSVNSQELIDRIKLVPGKRVVSSLRANPITRGWSCQPRGKTYDCSGPAAERVYLNFALTERIEVPPSVGLELGYQGKTLSTRELPVQSLERIEVLRGPQGSLSVPPGVRAGEVFVISPEVDIPGTWRVNVGGNPIDPIDPATIRHDDQLGPGRGQLFRMPETATGSDSFRFTFDGPFGRRWVDAPAPDDFWGGPAEPCEAKLEVCQERTTVNGTLCLCGCFPGLSWLGLNLDGQPIPMPVSSSSRAIRIPLPEGIAPGRHTVTWAETGQSMEFEAVQVRGSIDRNKLKSGQSAALKFWLEGTDASLPMSIELTEGNVSIVGGNRQVALTVGGADNHIQRLMFAEAPGDFSIQFSFAAAPCPCPAEPETSLLDDSRAMHPAQAEGGLLLDFRSGAKGRFPMSVRTDSLALSTEFPPFSAGQDLEIEFLQLGLRATSPGYGEFVFEERADRRSLGRFSDIEVTDEGGFGAGTVDLELYADFTTPFDKKLPIEVGKSYDLRLSEFELDGAFPGIGSWTFRERPGTESTLRLENIRKDAASTTLRGDATFRMYGLSKMQLRF